MGFERFTQRGLGRGDRRLRDYFTLTLAGNFAFDVGSWEQIGAPTQVVLLFDEIQRVIGVRATDPDDDNGYRVGRSGNGCLVTAARFCRYYNIDHSVARRRPAHVDGDTLFAFLDDDQTIVVTPGRLRV